jgi:hypothetical protein
MEDLTLPHFDSTLPLANSRLSNTSCSKTTEYILQNNQKCICLKFQYGTIDMQNFTVLDMHLRKNIYRLHHKGLSVQ